jgi:uncharacterized membrane-anchored protein
MMAGLLIGAHNHGLVGALVGQGAAMVMAYPMVVWLARRHAAWDARHDMVFWGVAVALAGVAIWFNLPAISGLSALNLP